MRDFLWTLYHICAELAPWLLIGLLSAALLRTIIPMQATTAWLSRGPRWWQACKAALIGIPMTLCSCSVLPVAMTLRREGASKTATASFLISTPQTGIDSLAVSWGLLGPFLTIFRPIIACVSAISAGVFAGWSETIRPPTQVTSDDHKRPPFYENLMAQLKWAIDTLLGDLVVWILIGTLMAAAVHMWVPQDLMATYGQGWLGYLLILLISIPMYTCATASTPLAASLLIAGASPGVVLTFLLAGPATNLGTFGAMKQEIGGMSTLRALLALMTTSILCGVGVDMLAYAIDWQPLTILSEDIAHEHTSDAKIWQACALVLLIGLSLITILKRLWRRFVMPPSVQQENCGATIAQPKQKPCCCQKQTPSS